MRRTTLINLHASAVIFVKRGGCSTEEIAETLKIPRNTIYRFAKMPEWDEALDTLGYKGDRNFTTRKRGTKGIPEETVRSAKAIYINRRKAGLKKSRAVSEVLKTVDIRDRRTINALIEKHNWDREVSK